MAIYVAMEPTGNAVADRADGVVFIRDGFSFLAFILPVVWLLWYRLWIEAALALAALFGLAALANATSWPPFVAPLLSLLISIYVGLEGAALRIAALRRRGWRERVVVRADSQEDAATRYFVEDVEVENNPVVPAAARDIPAARFGPIGPALGLFDYPGRR